MHNQPVQRITRLLIALSLRVREMGWRFDELSGTDEVEVMHKCSYCLQIRARVSLEERRLVRNKVNTKLNLNNNGA